MTFGNSTWLWALLLLLPLSGLFYVAHQRRQKLLAQMISSRLVDSLLQTVKPWKRNTRTVLILLAWACLIVALAQPRVGYEEKKITVHGRDVILAIDTSRSMLATDVTPTRLARAQLLGQDVLDLLPGDRVGLIAFAGDAFLQAPMTLDHSAVAASLAELDATVIPKGGTDITSAIRTAEVAFGKGEGTSRALIIITDGEDLEEDAIAEAKNAASQGIKIFTIGIGSAEGSLIPIKNEQGDTDFVRDEQGKPVLSKLDVARLKEIAQAAGGFYEPFSSQAAKVIVEKGIVPLEAGNTGDMMARRPIERYEIPVGAALLLLLLWVFLREGRFQFSGFKKIRKKELLQLILVGWFLNGALAHATPGLNDYQQGNYQAALDSFEQRLHSGNQAPEVRFDAGTAAYKSGDYKKAVDYFTSAMTAPAPALQQAATYNLANALVRSGEAAQDSTEKLSDWKNAIQHYDTVLKKDPNNKPAQENRAIVKKLIEEFQKQQEEQKKNPQQNKDQQKQQQKDQQQQPPNDKNQSGQGNNNQQQQPSPSNPSNAAKDQQSSSSGSQQQASPTPTPTPSSAANGSGAGAAPTPTPAPSSSPSSSGAEKNSSTPQQSSSQPQQPGGGSAPQPTPGEKKSGDLKAVGQDQPQTAAEAAKAQEAAEEKKGAMSPHQAEALLRSVQEEEEHIKFQQRSQSDETTTTKDW